MVEAVAGRTGLSQNDVRRTLEQLDSLDPEIVDRNTDANLDVEFWIALEPAIDAVEPPR